MLAPASAPSSPHPLQDSWSQQSCLPTRPLNWALTLRFKLYINKRPQYGLGLPEPKWPRSHSRHKYDTHSLWEMTQNLTQAPWGIRVGRTSTPESSVPSCPILLPGDSLCPAPPSQTHCGHTSFLMKPLISQIQSNEWHGASKGAHAMASLCFFILFNVRTTMWESSFDVYTWQHMKLSKMPDATPGRAVGTFNAKSEFTQSILNHCWEDKSQWVFAFLSKAGNNPTMGHSGIPSNDMEVSASDKCGSLVSAPKLKWPRPRDTRTPEIKWAKKEQVNPNRLHKPPPFLVVNWVQEVRIPDISLPEDRINAISP